MKQYPIFLISFLLCTNSIAQNKIEGIFRIKDNINFYTPELDEFIFRNDGKIIMIRETDIGTCFGFGNYSILGNQFEIIFDSIPISIKDSLKSYYTSSNYFKSNDTMKYELSVLNYDFKPLEYSVVILKNVNGNERKYFSDESGKVKIYVTIHELPVNLKVSYISFESLEIGIKDSLNKSIEIVFKNIPVYCFNVGEICKFRIRNITEDSFYIKSFFENKWLPYEKAE